MSDKLVPLPKSPNASETTAEPRYRTARRGRGLGHDGIGLMTTMVLVSADGVVHDLSTDSGCPQITNLRREFSLGTECYTRVKGVQALVYGLGGCTQCFGTQAAFQQYIRTV